MLNTETEHLAIHDDIEASQVVGRFDINLFDLMLYLAQRKRSIVRTTLVATLLTAGVSFLFKNTYLSTAVILPPRQEQSTSMLLSGQLGAISAMGGGGLSSMGLNLKNPNEIYSGLLLSRSVGTQLVNKFDLKKRFDKKTTEDAIKALASHTTIELSKDNLIRISISSHDANFSSDLANAYVDELHDLNTNLALTESSQRRYFFQQQLDREKVFLANAETDLRETQKRTGVVQPSGQADMVARNISTIRAQITARQAELQSLKAFATTENPDYIRMNAQVTSLQHELEQLENSEKAFTPGDIEVPTSKLPESSLEFARKLREVRLHESVYELLIKQFEAAKIDEAKTAPVIQVVDRAVPAERKSGPPRLLITVAAGILTFVFTCIWFAVGYVLDLVRSDAENEPKFALLRTTLFGRR